MAWGASGFTPWPPETAARYVAEGYWENRTIAEMVFATARRMPDKTAVVAGEQRLSYADLQRQTERLACRLLDVGLRAQDRVVMQLPNTMAFVPTYLALVRIGAIPVMALRVHRQTEIRHFINAAGAGAYVIPDEFHGFDYRDMAAALAAECPSLRRVLVLGDPRAGQISLSGLLSEDVPAATVADALRHVRPDPMDVATMLLSGGTTSVSKLIPRTHNDYVLNARCCAEAGGFGERTVFMAMLPLGHNYNLASPGLLGAFYHGGTLVICPSGDAETVFAMVEKERVTVIAGAVPLITNWVNSPAVDRFDLSSLAVVQNGGARLAPELRQRVRQRLHCTPQEIYGTAEGLINMVRLNDADDLLLESSGAPVCDADEIRVVDDLGNDVPDGTPGELITRGPYTIRGYYNAPEKNREAFTADGYYRMGDVVKKRGRHVFAEGRRKDLINRGGEKISCEEVENLVLKHPGVKAVSLVAMPDETFGEKACAFVILKPEAALTFGELVAFLKRQEIASFKLPERLELVPEFPLSPVGKILKSRLREIIADRLAAERAAAAQSDAGERRAMKIGVIGGGPGGLFFAYLMKKRDPKLDITVAERNAADATYGFGVVFSDVALSFVRDVDAALYDALTRDQVVNDSMRIVHRDVAVKLANNVFYRMPRLTLLQVLHRFCAHAGVRLDFSRHVKDIGAFAGCDLIVAADGANSGIRTAHRDRFQPEIDLRPNKLAWYATSQPIDPLSLIFRQTEHGLMIAHAYRYSPTRTTFLVECDPQTWTTAGLDRMSEADSVACCERVFAPDLDGHPLLSNRSDWFNYPIVKNRHWHFDHVVLLGDALRTGHPSVGSGTRLAMQDAIALFEACRQHGEDVPAALAAFERNRRPGSDALQAAAIKSTQWYESVRSKLHLDPVSFAYDYVRRTGKVSHAELARRDPELATAYEKLHPEGVSN